MKDDIDVADFSNVLNEQKQEKEPLFDFNNDIRKEYKIKFSSSKWIKSIKINSNNNMIAIPKYPPIIVPNDLTVACFLLLFLFLWVANTAAIPAKKGVYIFEGAFQDDLSIPTSLSINNNNI